MASETRIGFVFIPGFADWEFGFLAASAVEWFGAKTTALTPERRSVVSIGGFSLSGERGLTAEANADLSAVVVIGSDTWAENNPPDIAPLVNAVAERGGVVAGICAGTLALARAGLFENAAHTSNGRDWILGHLPAYAGAGNYRDVPHAVTDGKLITAPGSAPGTFAIEVLRALYPQKTKEFDGMRETFAKEYAAGETA